MAFEHPNSVECTKSELDLFSVPSAQVSLERGKWIGHEPVSSIGDGGSITHFCPPALRTMLICPRQFC